MNAPPVTLCCQQGAVWDTLHRLSACSSILPSVRVLYMLLLPEDINCFSSSAADGFEESLTWSSHQSTYWTRREHGRCRWDAFERLALGMSMRIFLRLVVWKQTEGWHFLYSVAQINIHLLLFPREMLCSDSSWLTLTFTSSSKRKIQSSNILTAVQ